VPFPKIGTNQVFQQPAGALAESEQDAVVRILGRGNYFSTVHS
jgi:hypothetical protein